MNLTPSATRRGDLKLRSQIKPLLGLEFSGFQTLVAQSSSCQIPGQILGVIQQHNLGLDLLLAGLNVDGAHLYAITHPGILIPLETVGFGSIGSGGIHASVRLGLAQQTGQSTFIEPVYNLFEVRSLLRSHRRREVHRYGRSLGRQNDIFRTRSI